MTPAFPTRRRAEAFDALVEARSTGALGDVEHAARDPRFADLLEVVGALRSAPAPTPRPEFVADLRSRLMTEAETALAVRPEAASPRTQQHSLPQTRTRERRLATAIGGFAIVSATASMAVAAQSALPGDTLYPLKRGIENAQVKVHSGDDSKGAALLENAAGRLDEVDELSRDGDDRATDVAATLDDFSAQASEASELLLDDYDRTGRVASLEELRAFTADSLAALEGLEGLVPAGARDALVDAAQTVTRIDEQAKAACPTCTDGPAAVNRLFVDASSVPGALDGLTGPARPARAETPGSSAGNGSGRDDSPATPAPAPEPTPSGGATSPPGEPSLPAGGTNQPPTTSGDGADTPLGGVVDGITRGGSGGTGTSGGGTGGAGTSSSTGLDELTAGLGDLLDN